VTNRLPLRDRPGYRAHLVNAARVVGNCEGKPVEAYELEPSVLSYAAFQSREALRAWYARKREYEQQHGVAAAPHGEDAVGSRADLSARFRAARRPDS